MANFGIATMDFKSGRANLPRLRAKKGLRRDAGLEVSELIRLVLPVQYRWQVRYHPHHSSVHAATGRCTTAATRCATAVTVDVAGGQRESSNTHGQSQQSYSNQSTHNEAP